MTTESSDMKNPSYFSRKQNDLYRPKKEDFTTYYHYSKGECIGQSNDRAKLNAPLGAIIEKDCDEDAYRAAMSDYHRRWNEIYIEFRDWCFDDLGIMDNPRKMKLWSYVCNHYECYGFSDMHSHMEELVDLIN